MKTKNLLQLLIVPALLAASAASLSAGSIARLIYPSISNAGSNATQRSSVDTLKSAPSFPNAPGFREQLDDFSQASSGAYIFGLQARDVSGDDYGSWIRGYLEAPVTGSYLFFIASDDASELWLGTNHLESSKQRIAYESSAGASLFGPVRLAQRRSAPISLVRGQKYFLEVFHKEAAGSAALQVGWQRPDGGQEILPARHLVQHPLDPFLGQSDPNLAPQFNFQGVGNFGDLPFGSNVLEGAELVLEIDPIAAQPTTFHWSSNGIPLPGENLSFLRIPYVSATANGAAFQVIVSNQFGTLPSATTTLSVSADGTSPAVVLVDDRGNPNGVRVTFNELVSAATAQNLANYALSVSGSGPIPISSAVLLSDQKSVQLSGSFNFAFGGSYDLTVQNVQDQALTPNTLAPNPTTATFSYSGTDLGPVGFADQSSLTNQSVIQNRLVHFEVTAGGAPPYFYQWLRNGTLVSGATSNVLEFLAGSTNAGNYSVVVSNEFSQATSVSATLTVLPDTFSPRIVSVRGLAGGLNEVQIIFDEILDPVSSTIVSNYAVGLLPVYAATRSANGKTVTLRTGTLQNNQVYLLTLTGVKDLAGAALSTTAAFTTELNYVGEITADNPVRYWRFTETDTNRVASLVSGIDTLANAYGTINGAPLQGAPSLVPNLPDDSSIQFFSTISNQYIVPVNGSDLNATAGPWAKKTIEFWFRATSVPAPGTTGRDSTAGLFEEGAGSRNLTIYLRRDPSNNDPNQAQLVFSGVNNVAGDGPGSPWGLPNLPEVATRHPVVAGQTYHVVAVFDGDAAGTNGFLILYLNGVEVSRTGGAGQIYNHTGDIQIGQGNTLTAEVNPAGTLGFFDGFIDEFSAFNGALNPARIHSHYAAGTVAPASPTNDLAVARVDTRGHPNQLLVTFNKPVSGTASNLANYTLTRPGGAGFSLTNATLLAGERTVLLRGSDVNFQVTSNYVLTVANITAQGGGALTPSPTNIAFAFVPAPPAFYDFNAANPSYLETYGRADVVPGGSYDNSGYLRLTDATNSAIGAVRFKERTDVDQAHIHFKVSLTNDAATRPGEGFSVELAADLPAGTYTGATIGEAEEGYIPILTASADRLVVAFDNFKSTAADTLPSVAVKWRGVVITNVLTGTNGIPALNNTSGAWADVDITVLRGGRTTVQYDGVTVINNVATGFDSIVNAQLGLAARTLAATNETHWIDDLYVSYFENAIGRVGVGPNSELSNISTIEGQTVRFSVQPTGAGPFAYQWYRNGVAISNGTSRVLSFTSATNRSGTYWVVLRNEFSQTNSFSAQLVVDDDATPPVVQNVNAFAGSLNQIRILFNEVIDPVTGTNITKYSAPPLTILGASLSADGRTVTLYTSPQNFQQTYNVQVTGVKDRSVRGNSFSGLTNAVSTISYPAEVLSDAPARYWRFNELSGLYATSTVTVLDPFPLGVADVAGILQGRPSLVPNTSDDPSYGFQGVAGSFLNIQNGSDININVGPWTNKSVEFWFRAESVPPTNSTGFNVASAIWEEGAGNRGISVYLYRDPSNSDPESADLVFNSWNNPNEGPGSPFGVPAVPAFILARITNGVTYHVVATHEGNAFDVTQGYLRLYLNGVQVAQRSGAGYLYNHSGSIELGRGNSLLHTSTTTTTGNLRPFHGTIDEFSYYNTLLTPARVAAHYAAALVYAGPPRLGSYERLGNSVRITWTDAGRLQRATNATGPFTDVPGATSPYQEIISGETVFFRFAR